MKKVAIIHTFLYSVEDLKVLFQKYVPEVEMINIIDDSLLQEALANKGVTKGIHRRMIRYAFAAQDLGADMILNQCSSVGEVADYIAPLLNIPYVKIDAPMAKEAVSLGSRIGVVATAVSTVGPSTRIVEKAAKEMGKEVKVTPYFADGAYEALLKENNKAKHDEIVLATINKAAAENDAVVLAQGSMYKLMPLLTDIKKPVLTSFESGVKQIRDVLGLDK